MKKITLLAIFGVTLMALSACNKEEVPASKTLKLDLNIKHSSDTKAVKKGWESGDNIYVFFGNPQDHPKHDDFVFCNTGRTIADLYNNSELSAPSDSLPIEDILCSL